MCGIAGIIEKREHLHESVLQTLAQSLAHRGPDDEGIEIIPAGARAVGLVHRRLAIIDLSPAGHQPMRDAATGNWIVFNGEIYNYRTLKAELEKARDTFVSESDTEVILKAYARWGTECLSRFRGMFAFALWDAKQKRLFCAVDRFGIKPFYFFHSGTTFAFASEVKALLASGIVPKVIDRNAVHSFLSFGAVQAPMTMIEGVHAMLPGEYLIFDVARNDIHIEQYWNPGDAFRNSPHPSLNVREGVIPPLIIRGGEGELQRGGEPPPWRGREGLRETLEDTVRHHLVSDVPVGLFLSGGVDSSALAILVNRVAGRTLDSFSVTFAEKEYAEGHYARMIGEKFCARHHELTMTDHDLETFLPEALAAQDQPTIDGVNAYVISKTVHDAGIKVVLSGQGGDEVFGGYPTFQRIPRMVQWFRFVRILPRWKRTLLSRMIGEGGVARSKIGQYLTSNGDLQSFYTIARQLFSPTLTPTLSLRERETEGRVRGSQLQVHELDGLDLFSKISLLEMRGYLANMLLRDGDVMSMAHGLEVRVPYLDHVLVERVFGVSASEKVSRRMPKPLLLRAVMSELPRAIWARKKMGFTFPWDVWLRGRLRGEVEATLSALPNANPLGLNRDACLSLWRAFLGRKKGITWSRVWALYVLVAWIRRNGL